MIFSLGNKIVSSFYPFQRGTTPVVAKTTPSYAIDILSNISPPEIQTTSATQDNPNLYSSVLPSKLQRSVLAYDAPYYTPTVCPPPSGGSPSILEYTPFVFDSVTKTWCNKT